MDLSSRELLLSQRMFVSSATQQHELGARGATRDGRIYRYCKAGAVDLIAGRSCQSSVVVATDNAAAVHTTGATVGATAFTITCVSSVAANFYADGYAIIATSAGAGYLYTINSHPAVSTGTAGVFTLYPEDAILVAITSTSKVTLSQNKYQGVVVTPATTATGVIVGVSTYIITASQFGWIQTWGPCAVLCNDASALGQWMNGIAASCGALAGMSSPAVTACYIVGQFVGHIVQTGIAGQYCIFDLRIAP